MKTTGPIITEYLILLDYYRIKNSEGDEYNYFLKFTNKTRTFHSLLKISVNSITSKKLKKYIVEKTVLLVSFDNASVILENGVEETTQNVSQFFDSFVSEMKLDFISDKTIDEIFGGYYWDRIISDTSGNYTNAFEDSEVKYVSENRLLEVIDIIYFQHVCRESKELKPDNNCICYKNSHNWCEDKATLILNYFDHHDVYLKKIFLSGLLFSGTYGGIRSYWDFHVALVAFVEDSVTQLKKRVVIDFTFSKSPMSIEEWIEQMANRCNKNLGKKPTPKSYYSCFIASRLYKLVGSSYTNFVCCKYLNFKPDDRNMNINIVLDPEQDCNNYFNNRPICISTKD